VLDFIVRILLRFGETERVLVLKLRETVLKLVETRSQSSRSAHIT
jgi:hypothetical protein